MVKGKRRERDMYKEFYGLRANPFNVNPIRVICF